MKQGIIRLKIGMDLDGVVVDLVEAMIPLLSAKANRQISKSDIVTFDIGQALSIETAEMDKIWRHVIQDGFYATAPAISGAIEGLYAIRHHEIWFVSSRPKEAKRQTEEWLNRYRVDYAYLILNDSQKNVAVRYNFHICVEDNLDRALQVVNAGIHSLLFDQPWNQSTELPKGCIRVRTWHEIVQCVETISRN